MRVKYITRMFSRLSRIDNLDPIKRYFYILIVISVLGTLGSIPVSKGIQERSWLFTLSFLNLGSQFSNINDLAKRKYALFDNDEDNDFSVKDSQILSKLFAVAIGLLMFPSINLQWWETFFDKLRFFYYIFFFSSIPLRSPPLFS